MAFQWLQMRVSEEKDRRQRESSALERLPMALQELHTYLASCVTEYTEAFGAESAEIVLMPTRVKVTSRDEREGRWHPAGKVEVVAVADIPGFRVERGEYSMAVEVGVLPSNKLFYRDREQDKYLTMEELTRRILDRVLFPKLRD
ncbi:MAG: hypothetical protein JWP63_4398 [Candidatus Solibacter sp.]|jgi:hypothetical protein|nr:hypothetical protein [Candidatus Solibacter sp.]